MQTTRLEVSHEVPLLFDRGNQLHLFHSFLIELFDLLIESSQCKHIMFGGCHDQGYLSLLTPHKKVDSRITLLKATTCHTKFRALGFRAIECPTVFKSEPLPKEAHHETVHIPQQSRANNNQNGRPWSQKGGTPKPDGARGHLERVIYLNANDQRVDHRLTGISDQGRTRFKSRIDHQKLCNEFHLLGKCPALPGRACVYDHGYADPELIMVLQERLRAQQCKKGGSCRSFDCYYGHVCHRAGCEGGKGCSFGGVVHGLGTSSQRVLREEGGL